MCFLTVIKLVEPETEEGQVAYRGQANGILIFVPLLLISNFNHNLEAENIL